MNNDQDEVFISFWSLEVNMSFDHLLVGTSTMLTELTLWLTLETEMTNVLKIGGFEFWVSQKLMWRCWGSNPDHNIRFNNFNIFAS